MGIPLSGSLQILMVLTFAVHIMFVNFTVGLSSSLHTGSSVVADTGEPFPVSLKSDHPQCLAGNPFRHCAAVVRSGGV
jgi:hypothetical protein